MVLDICEPRMRDAWNPTDPQWSPWEGRTHRASGCLFLPNHGQGGLRCLCWGARGKGRAAGLQALYQEYGQQQLETSFSSRVWNEANGLRCPSMLLHDSCLSLYLSFSCTDTRCIFFFSTNFQKRPTSISCWADTQNVQRPEPLPLLFTSKFESIFVI